MLRKVKGMRRFIRPASATGLIVAGVTAAVLFEVASAGAQTEIRVDIPPGVGTLVDLDGDGRVDIGDRFTGRSRLDDPDTGERAGRIFFECIATTPIVLGRHGGTWLCTYDLELPDGHITVQGADPSGLETHVMAVTGGTGEYRDARGEATEADTELAEEITIHLEP